MADEDLRTMVREFRESMTEAVADIIERIEGAGRRIDENSRRIEEQGNELRHRISVAETAILNTIRDQARLYDRRTTRLEVRVDRMEDRLDLPDEGPPGAA